MVGVSHLDRYLPVKVRGVEWTWTCEEGWCCDDVEGKGGKILLQAGSKIRIRLFYRKRSTHDLFSPPNERRIQKVLSCTVLYLHEDVSIPFTSVDDPDDVSRFGTRILRLTRCHVFGPPFDSNSGIRWAR